MGEVVHLSFNHISCKLPQTNEQKQMLSRTSLYFLSMSTVSCVNHEGLCRRNILFGHHHDASSCYGNMSVLVMAMKHNAHNIIFSYMMLNVR